MLSPFLVLRFPSRPARPRESPSLAVPPSLGPSPATARIPVFPPPTPNGTAACTKAPTRVTAAPAVATATAARGDGVVHCPSPSKRPPPVPSIPPGSAPAFHDHAPTVTESATETEKSKAAKEPATAVAEIPQTNKNAVPEAVPSALPPAGGPDYLSICLCAHAGLWKEHCRGSGRRAARPHRGCYHPPAVGGAWRAHACAGGLPVAAIDAVATVTQAHPQALQRAGAAVVELGSIQISQSARARASRHA